MGAMASQITSLTIVYSVFDPGADQRKHQSSAPLATGIVTGEYSAQIASNAENDVIMASTTPDVVILPQWVNVFGHL